MAGRGHKDIFAANMEWTKVGEGVRYTQFSLDESHAAEAPLVILSVFEPGELVNPHTHGCNYLEYIVQGSQMVGKVNFKAGDVRWAAAGTGYGPIKVGADGCTVLIVFQEAGKSSPTLLGKASKLAA